MALINSQPNDRPTVSEIGAVPVSRTINGKSLNNNIILTANDVGAIGGDNIYTKDQTLTDATKSMYNLPSSADPNMVLQKLAMPYGYYGFDITTIFSDGTIAPNIILNGVTDFNGNTVKTDANGRCPICVSQSATPTVSISGYLDVKDKSVTLSSSNNYVFTPNTITLELNSSIQTFRTSTTKMVTGATKFDFCAVGGGGGGTCSRWGKEYGGAGGGGGYVNSVTGISLPNSTISFTVGAGGGYGHKDSDASDGSAYAGAGGASYVKNAVGETIVSANGGSGASKGVGGAGNGKGGNTNSVGQNGTGYLFNDSSLGVAGGGGGGGGNDGSVPDGGEYPYDDFPYAGGSPYGGQSCYRNHFSDGGWLNVSATSGRGPGGGGGGGALENGNNTAASGASGGIIVRAKF